MGRLTPVPYEGHGGTAAEVAQSWRNADQRRRMECGLSRQRLRDQAEQWLSAFPEFADTDGRPCPWAIEAALSLRDQYGKAVTRQMVHAAWTNYMARTGLITEEAA